MLMGCDRMLAVLESPLLFVVGNSRSGTTMMGRIFGRHSLVFTFGELHYFEHLVSPDEMQGRCPISPDRALDLTERMLSSQRDGFFSDFVPGKYADEAQKVLSRSMVTADVFGIFETCLCYETARHGKVIPCEQTPRNLFYLQEILAAYPNARVVYMVRDPRDVLLSQKNKWRRRFLGARNIPLLEAVRAWVNYHPLTIAKLWCAAECTAARFETDPRVVNIRFEDLLSDPQGQVERACAAIGLASELTMLDVPMVGSSLGQDEPERKGVDASRAGSWRRGGLSAEEIWICQRTAGAAMRRRGYEVEPVQISVLRLAWLLMAWPIKISLALVLNLRRTRNMLESIRRRLV